MISHLFILGNHVQGLGVSRLAKKNGLSVWLFNNSGLCITRYSNTCSRFIEYSNNQDLLSKLLKNAILGSKPILMPTNDMLVWFVAENYEALSNHFFIPLPTKSITEIAYNKIKTYKVCEELNIPCPKSYFPNSFSEVEQLSSAIEYPVVIKPAIMHKYYGKTGKKMIKCNSSSELLSGYLQFTKVIPKDEIIIQEMLTGGPQNLYSFGSFCDGKKVWVSLTANRIRQKPMDFGISTTFAQSVVVREIELAAIKFLTGIGFFGISEVEFMFDTKTNSFKLLEINPRTWKWHSIANILGVDLLKPMIQHWQNSKIEEKHNIKTGFGWIERLTDFFVFVKEFLGGRMSLKDYIKSFNIPKESAVFSKKDPLPAIMYIVLSPLLFLKR